MNTLKSLFSNTIFSITVSILNRLANMLIFVIVINYLGIESGGRYNIALSFFFIGSRFAFWGLDQLLTREVAKNRNSASRYLANFIYARFLLAIIDIAMFILIIQLTNYDSEAKLAITLFLLSILPENVNNLCWGGYAAFEEYYLTSISVSANMVFKVGLTFLFIKMGMALPMIILAILIGHVTAMIINLSITRRRYLSDGWQAPDFEFIRQQLRIAVPFLFIGIFFILDNRLDVILLSTLNSEVAAGLYGAATTIISAFTILPEGYRIAVLPVMSRFLDEDNAALQLLYERSFKFLFIIAIPIMVVIVFLAQDVIPLIYRNDLPEAATSLRILSVSLTFTFLIVVNNRLLIVHNRQDIIARILITSTAINLIANFLLAPQLGAVGSSIARSSSMFLVLLLTTWAANKYVTRVGRIKFVWRPILAGSIMAVAIWQFAFWGFWIKAIIGLVVYFVFLLLMGTFSAQELYIVRQVVNKLIPRTS